MKKREKSLARGSTRRGRGGKGGGGGGNRMNNKDCLAPSNIRRIRRRNEVPLAAPNHCDASGPSRMEQGVPRLLKSVSSYTRFSGCFSTLKTHTKALHTSSISYLKGYTRKEDVERIKMKFGNALIFSLQGHSILPLSRVTNRVTTLTQM